jgi:antitoxin VapB
MSVTAKLFMQDDCQALDLPEEFRFEGEEVQVSKVGDKVILEPLKMPPVDIKAFVDKLDALGAPKDPADEPASGLLARIAANPIAPRVGRGRAKSRP